MLTVSPIKLRLETLQIQILVFLYAGDQMRDKQAKVKCIKKNGEEKLTYF